MYMQGRHELQACEEVVLDSKAVFAFVVQIIWARNFIWC